MPQCTSPRLVLLKGGGVGAEQEAGLAAQQRDLKHAGCERLFSEQVSSVAQQLQLAAALNFVRDEIGRAHV